MADGDFRCVREGIPQREPGQMAGDRIVELQGTLVAQLDDGGIGEELGERGHPVDGIGSRGRFFIPIAVAESPGPDEILVENDAHGHARQFAVGRLRFDPGLQQVDGCLELGVLRQRIVLRLAHNRFFLKKRCLKSKKSGVFCRFGGTGERTFFWWGVRDIIYSPVD